MNIGFANVYAYRPHGHHAKFLSHLTKKLGYKAFSLDCFGAPSTCYVREYKGVGRLECLTCSLGGLHSFGFDSSELLRHFSSKTIDGRADDMVRSSAYTLTRIESFEQRSSEHVTMMVDKLSGEAFRFYHSTKKWLLKNKIDAVFLFNGRMDYTRAILDACKDLNVKCITHERPLFGHGIILNKNSNCSSLEKIHWINKQFRNKPLNANQAQIASMLAAQRLIGGNPLEWKRYNENPIHVEGWPLKSSKRKILMCPSSKNELLGHPDWETPWKDNTDAIDYAVQANVFDYDDLLVRFHPSWNVNFGVVSAQKCEQHYRVWCQSRGISYIDSRSRTSTRDLMREADIILLNGSNALLEAGMLGKPVICFGASPYSHSGAAVDVFTFDEIKSLDFDSIVKRDPLDIIQCTLRYYYSKAAREPLFTDHVRSVSVTDCVFYDGADPQILQRILDSDEMQVDDYDSAESNEFERPFLEAFINRDFDCLQNYASKPWCNMADNKLKIERKLFLKLIDIVRNLRPKGV